MVFSLGQISGWVAHYGYAALLPIMVIEGPIITVLAGFFSSLGYLNIFWVYGVVVVGDLIGDALWYGLGRFGRLSKLERWGRYVGITRQRVERLEKHFHEHSGKTLVLGKLSHGVGAAFLFAAGVARMPFRRYLWFNFLATLPKSLLLLLVGFYFGQAVAKINSYLDFIAALSISVGLLFAFLLFLHFRGRDKDEQYE